jgi:ABC-2 type transport system permease protein
MTRYSPLKELTLARLHEFIRHPEAVFWVYGFPILMAIGLGIAFRNRPMDQIAVDIVAGARAEEVRAALQKDPRFLPEVHPEAECRNRVRIGRSNLAVVPAVDRAFDLLFDPTRPESVLARTAVDDALQRAAGRTDPVPIREALMEEPGSRYIDFLIPGLLGLNLMGGGLWGVGFVLVEMRVRKLLKRMIATPMKRWHFLLANLWGRMVFTVPEVALLLVAGYLIFGVEIRGNLVAVLLLAFLGAMSFAGLGLLLACRARTIESVSGLMNLAMLPMWILSGSFFSAERFPAAVQPLVQALPLTQLNNALRAVMLEGQSLVTQTTPIAILVAWGAVSFVLALKLFRWN